MKTSSGQETQAVYGFVSMVTKLLDDFAPNGDGCGLALCRADVSRRDRQGLQARPGTDARTADQQLELIRTFVKALGIPAL